MSEVAKIVRLLESDAIEKRIAAAIVLGELKAKGAEVVDALAKALEADIPLLRRHLLEALTQVGARRALERIRPLLVASNDEVRRAAVQAFASCGEQILPQVKAMMATASAEERRALDAVLAELGGKDAFSTLVRGLAASDPDAAKAAALSVRQKVKGADGRQRRSYLSEIEKLLASLKKPGKGATDGTGATAAALKILGYLEDEKTVPLLLSYAADEKQPASVRQEAIIGFRFALHNAKASAKVVDVLARAADSADRTLAQTALHTLGTLDLAPDSAKRVSPLAKSRDLERARFAIGILGKLGGEAAAEALVDVLIDAKDRRFAEAAAAALSGRADAVAPLARALLALDDPDRAWTVRNVLRPAASRIAAPLKRQLLERAIADLGAGKRGWEALLGVVRDGDSAAVTAALREKVLAFKKAKRTDAALRAARELAKTEGATSDDRYALAALELAQSRCDTQPSARASDEALRGLAGLVAKGFDVGRALRRDKSLSPEHLYYVAFHFAEQRHPLGEELLSEVTARSPRSKLGKMAKNKLALVQRA